MSSLIGIIVPLKYVLKSQIEVKIRHKKSKNILNIGMKKVVCIFIMF